MEDGAGLSTLDLGIVKAECIAGIVEASRRGILHTAKWLALLNTSLEVAAAATATAATSMATDDADDSVAPLSMLHPQHDHAEIDKYLLGKSLYDCQEYDRAAFFLDKCTFPAYKFLYFYSRYMSAEKKRLDNMTEKNCSPDSSDNIALKELYEDLKLEYKSDKLDGYSLFLYGMILRKLELEKEARCVLLESVKKCPCLWGAWLELAALLPDRETLEALSLPHHWMTPFFLGHAYLELKLIAEAVEIYERLKVNGFNTFTYVSAQLGIAFHDNREVDDAITMFKMISRVDPYRLENMDTYSHLLYVKELKTELANLAHKVVDIDKYRVETCCVIGNYYSLRGEHHKAVVYFQRALRLNPNYLSAWILMGHEFVELQNTNAAIQSYRKAIEVNRHDFRAWNGLGQAYEILGLNGYCVYYYARAAQQCPGDSRMLIAVGEAFEKLDKIKNALKCYHRAYNVGDIEGMALLKLAKLYDKLLMRDSAAAAYSAACQSSDTNAEKGLQEAFRYLSNYHLNNNNLDYAAHYAYKCLEHEETKEEGKSLLKTISDRRAVCSDPSTAPSIPNTPASESLDISDMPLTPRPNCAITLNYNTTPSSTKSEDSSRYKL